MVLMHFPVNLLLHGGIFSVCLSLVIDIEELQEWIV
jgi:hypothetical protein